MPRMNVSLFVSAFFTLFPLVGSLILFIRDKSWPVILLLLGSVLGFCVALLIVAYVIIGGGGTPGYLFFSGWQPSGADYFLVGVPGLCAQTGTCLEASTCFAPTRLVSRAGKQYSSHMLFGFTKYHALGNDYLVIDPKDLPSPLTTEQVRVICHRNFGVGSDGILLGPLPAENAKCALRIYNPDGSEAEKSGNGLRIFSRYLWDRKMVGDEEFTVQTAGGLVSATVLMAARWFG